MIQVTSLRLLSQADAARASHMPENAPRETPTQRTPTCGPVRRSSNVLWMLRAF